MLYCCYPNNLGNGVRFPLAGRPYFHRFICSIFYLFLGERVSVCVCVRAIAQYVVIAAHLSHDLLDDLMNWNGDTHVCNTHNRIMWLLCPFPLWRYTQMPGRFIRCFLHTHTGLRFCLACERYSRHLRALCILHVRICFGANWKTLKVRGI